MALEDEDCEYVYWAEHPGLKHEYNFNYSPNEGMVYIEVLIKDSSGGVVNKMDLIMNYEAIAGMADKFGQAKAMFDAEIILENTSPPDQGPQGCPFCGKTFCEDHTDFTPPEDDSEDLPF